MTYKINGTDLPVQPSDCAWSQRKALGLDGYNRTIYEPTYSFTMSFDGMSQADFDQLRDFWNTLNTATTLSVTIPQRDASTYTFKTYTGCVMDEPTTGNFFNSYQTGIRVIFRGIRL